MLSFRRTLIVAAVLLQCVALGLIGYQREAVLHSGQTVVMRTRPVDPRDLFRGDYVRLTYEASNLPVELVPKDDLAEMRKGERRVYLSYTTDARNQLVPRRLSLSRPLDGPFIRGYSLKDWRNEVIAVRYGVEKYFVQQGRGLELERGQIIEGVRIPLEVEVAVGPGNGIAVLKGYRLADLGMGITLPRAARAGEQPLFMITVKIANASLEPVCIVDPPDHRSFELVLSTAGAPQNSESVRFKQPRSLKQTYLETDLKLIPPQAAYQFELDLTEPAYQLVRGDQDVSWADMQYWETARIVYQAPEPVRIAGLTDSARLWQGSLESRSFSGFHFRD
jgi:uncharacterized membrane-anchored protein